MFKVQSGLIRRSLVALSTATVAEDDDEDAIGTISFSLSRPKAEETFRFFGQKEIMK